MKKKRGRPPGRGADAETRVSLRCSRELKTSAAAEARAAGVSLEKWIRQAMRVRIEVDAIRRGCEA